MLKFITDCLYYVRVKPWCDEIWFIIICQKANGDQCSGSTCLHEVLRNSSGGRGMVCVFWDRQDVILVNFMSRGHNANAHLLYFVV